MILITGATGLLGGAVVERLLQRLPAADIGVGVRDPDKVRTLANRGVDVRRGDYEDPRGLTRSFEGASRVLLVSSATHGEGALRQHRNAIAAAKAAGVERIVYTSHMGASAGSHFASMRDHAETERLLEASGVPFTALRNGFYASSALQFMQGAFETGRFFVPADGPVSWTAHADLAEVAVLTLTGDARLTGVTPPLTNSEALTFDDLAAIASELSGRTIDRVTVSDEDFCARLVSHGLPREQAEFLLGIFVASRDGEFAAVDPTLPDALGHAAVSMRDILRQRMPGSA